VWVVSCDEEAIWKGARDVGWMRREKKSCSNELGAIKVVASRDCDARESPELLAERGLGLLCLGIKPSATTTVK
jgi:hypothetical protein